MGEDQYSRWAHTHLTVDVVPGRGSGFSLEAPEGVRFIIRSRLLSGAVPKTDELAAVSPADCRLDTAENTGVGALEDSNTPASAPSGDKDIGQR